MLYSHLAMTEKEATLRLQRNYTEDINVFDDIENEAFKMADYMFWGHHENVLQITDNMVIREFPNSCNFIPTTSEKALSRLL